MYNSNFTLNLTTKTVKINLTLNIKHLRIQSPDSYLTQTVIDSNSYSTNRLLVSILTRRKSLANEGGN